VNPVGEQAEQVGHVLPTSQQQQRHRPLLPLRSVPAD
jgi:hypothetical protein